jgi:hypothetical protein
MPDKIEQKEVGQQAVRECLEVVKQYLRTAFEFANDGEPERYHQQRNRAAGAASCVNVLRRAFGDSRQLKREDAELAAKKDQLWDLCRSYFDREQISHPETIYQYDNVILSAHEFLEQVGEVIGFYQYPEDFDG